MSFDPGPIDDLVKHLSRLPGIGEAVVSFSGKINPRDVKDSHCGHLKRAPFIAEHWHK